MTTQDKIKVCRPKSLPGVDLFEAARVAVGINPANRPYVRPVADMVGPGAVTKEFISAMTTKYWKSGGVHLTVRFLDTDDTALKARILTHMNAWSPGANVQFSESRSNDAEVRIARTSGDGYWSYLGTDILQIPADQPTMNLEAFSMDTPESEYKRVVRHETGHTLGFPHEHLRREVVQRIDPRKAIRYFLEMDGWSEQVTRAQVLTPLEDVDLIATPTDILSIMCYQLPGVIMRDGQAVPGGLDLDPQDRKFVQGLYPTKLTATPHHPAFASAPTH
ncbi:M12 family metallopeptidase [Nocardia sp. SYP-A9097]|uniref:M12 family metallopeptidase n=1 Tax=Nocardia sp. SYP-A9097 TaxID=2663237 RepID=UPI001891CD61|nr:M12 family metallopeptidase [Nocardia sp. SYP-A9097]